MNRHQPQPYFQEVMRTGEGPRWWCARSRNTFDAGRGGGGGGGQLFNYTSVRTPCATPIIPLQGELYECVFSLLGWRRHCWVGQYGRGPRNALARCRSRHTPTQLSHAYLVKPLSLLPGPNEGEAIRSILSDQIPHMCKYYIVSGDAQTCFARTV